jgi:hypothetical protein
MSAEQARGQALLFRTSVYSTDLRSGLLAVGECEQSTFGGCEWNMTLLELDTVLIRYGSNLNKWGFRGNAFAGL